MYGSHTTRSIGRFQRTYEDRAREYRRQIEFLIRERQLYQDQLQDLQPTLKDDGQRLSHLDATIRYNISELQQHVIDYKAVEDWRKLGNECHIADHRDSDDWAHRMADSADAFFDQPALHPTTLDAQFVQLINDHRDLLDAVNDHGARSDPLVRAGFQHEAITPSPVPAAAPQQAAAVRVQESVSSSSEPALLAADEQDKQSSNGQLSDYAPMAEEDREAPAQASPRPQDRQRVTIIDDPMRHYYTDQSGDSPTSSRISLITTDAYVSTSRSPSADQLPAPHRGVPIVQQLDHDDNTTLSASPPPQDDDDQYESFGWDTYATPGVMTFADGNVAAATPIVWHTQRIGTPAYVTAFATDPSASLAAGFDRISIRPSRTAQPLPSRPAAPSTSHPATNTAGGRGPSSFFSSGPAVDTSGRLPSATLSSGPSGPPAPAPTNEAPLDRESTNAFYHNATFHRDTTTTAPLVLKELPITFFDGDIRRYPTFRNRFLDVVEGHRDLAPRHKLQYLLQFLRGEPLQLADNYQLTDENYHVVTELLEERYGDKDMIRNLLMADLIGLRPPSQAVADIRRFHGEAYRVTTDLKQLGDDVDSNRLYEQTLMSKLSPALKLELIRNTDYVKAKTASAILKGLHRYAQVLEAAATTGVLWSKLPTGTTCPSGRRTPPRPSSPRYSSNANRAPHSGYGAEVKDAPRAEPRQDRKKCAFCSLSHWATQCTVYPTIRKRYNRADQLRYCYLCLRGNHLAVKCPLRTSEPCRFCDRRPQHHRAFCREAPSRTWKTPRSDQVRTQGPRALGAPGGPSGDSLSVERHVPVKKAVHWNDSQGGSTARNVSPSTPRLETQGLPGGGANSKKINRKKRSRSMGASPQGRRGTYRPTTASTAEDIPTKGVSAGDLERFFTRVESLFTTARCPPNDDSAQFDRLGAGSRESSPDDWDAWKREFGSEDDSLPESMGHCSDAPTVPSDAGPDYDPFPTYQDQAAFAVSASLPADTQTVLLECAKVTAVNPTTGASRVVTAFFDQGSTLSYVSTALANDLDLPQQGRRRLRVNTFGSSKPLVMEGFSTTLVLRSQRGHSVSLHATAAPDCIVKAVSTALVEDHELSPLLQNEVTLIPSRETPDILIGQDTVQRFKREVKTRLPNGFDLIQTILGPMIGGAGRVANPSSNIDTTSAAICTSPSCPSGNAGTGHQIRLQDGSATQPIHQFPPPPPGSKFKPLPAPLAAESVQQAQTAWFAPLATPCLDVPDEVTVDGYFSGLVDKSDAEIFGDFSYLENAGIGTSEMTPDDQAAADMLERLITREPDGRYKVPLLFRTADGEPPSNNDLPTNMNLGKGRGISTRNSLARVPKNLAEYDGIIRDYKDRAFISTAPLRTKLTKHCLSHHPVHKETSTTTATRPVYDASAKLPGRSSLNDWLYRGPVLLPTVPAVLLRSRLPKIIVVCDIGKAFLQVAVKESHRDCLWFVWFKDPSKEPTDDNIIFYRFDRVPFGLKSSPYLLAGVIKKHLESEGTPLAHEMLKNCYVDNVLLMADSVEEALQKYHQSKAIFAKAQMPLREYASNNAKFNDALDPADRADLNKLRELGIRWDVTADYWDIPLRPKPPTRPALLAVSGKVASVKPTTAASTTTKEPAPLAATNGPVPSRKPKRNRRKKVDDGRLTKRSMLRFLAQVFDPLGLVQAALLLLKLVIQEVWKAGNDWDDDVSPEHARLWEEAIRDFDTTTIRIPRRIAVGKIDSAEIHVFTDGSSQAYGCTAYLRVLESDGTYRTNLVYARAKVKPIKDAEKYTIPRMELLGVLVGSRVIKFLHKELDMKITATYLWSDATIVLHQVADTEKIKEVFVHNRLKEIRQIRDEFHVNFRHVPTKDNPADIVSRGIAAADLQICEKWWHGAPFLALDSSKWPTQPPSLNVACPSGNPQDGSELYGSTAFATLYADAFIPQVSWRKLRRRKKPNPLDIITQPLPPTIYTVSAVAAITVASDVRIQPAETGALRPPPKLPTAPILPPVIGDAHFRWTEHVRISYYVLRAAAIMLRGARQRLGPRRHAPALGFALEDCLLESKPRRPSIRDLHVTEMIILQKTQLKHPPSDVDRQNLGIFEHQGLLYVKGRLGNMKLRPTALTPLYLPRQAPETANIIMDYHRNNGHAGTTTTLANIRMRYWFTQGRRTIRSAIRAHCFECRREAMQPCITPPWPQLPLSRVSQTRPFFHTGLDFFGPVYLRRPKDDGGFVIAKYSVAIFTCMTFRCVHLELCPDLSTQSFLDAFQRFGSRREFPARILSDNGLSFLTAREVIKQIRGSHAPPQPVKRRNPARAAVSARLAVRNRAPDPLSASIPSKASTPLNNVPQPPRFAVPPSDLTPDEERITDFCHRHHIEWQTITELSPWRGGSYERLIGIVKHSLKRSIGKSKPTEEQYRTLLACAERTTNCRPLSYVADSDTDFYLIRPIDILHPLLRDEAQKDPLDPPTDPTQARDDPDFVAPGENRLHSKLLRDLKKARDLADVFWQQFRDGVLLELRNRGIDSKRRQLGQNTIQAGDLVLVKEAGLPRTDWRLALVLELLPSADKLERSARIRFGRTHEETNRALEHLYPIGNVPARETTSCSTVAIEDIHSIFLLSVNDSHDTMHPAHELAMALDYEQLRVLYAAIRARLQTQSNPAPLAVRDASHTTIPDEAAPLSAEATGLNAQDPTALATTPATPPPPTTDGSPRRPRLPNEETDDDGVQRIIVPSSPPVAAVARADHADADQEDLKRSTTISSDSDSALLAADEKDDRRPTISSNSDTAPLAEEERDDRQPNQVPTASSDKTDVWDRLRATHAAAAAHRRQRLAEAAAQRQKPPTIVPGIMVGEEKLNDPSATKAPATSASASPAGPAPAAPTTSAPPKPTGMTIDLFATIPLIDWTRMPAHMSLEEIWERTRQFFSFQQDEEGNRLARIDNETLQSNPLVEPQQLFFWIKLPLPGLVDNSTWQPTVTCTGKDEPKCFHVSVGATLIIIKNRWLKFKQIAANRNLQKILDDLMRLHIRSFGQMILVVYAARLAGDHDRMGSILRFLDGVLRARDLDLDIADVVSRHVPQMVRGVDAKQHPYPYERDFEDAASRWCCYCYKAFVYIYEHLSGPLCWSPEWLRSTDIPKEFKRAIDAIVMKAKWILLTLKERIYKLYVLRRIQAAETGETTFVGPALKLGRRAAAEDWPDTLCTRTLKWILFVDDENDYLFCDELRNEKITIVRVPSTNREDVLRVVRNVVPGPDTDRVYFWFGCEYINNANHDYGRLITELCHHYTTFFGRLHQHVVLPPYNRLQADDWTFDVLGLYLQKDMLLPHARVVLHPYDVRLWRDDQQKFKRNGRLPSWTVNYQSANGTINNWSTVEARKLNMKVYHGSDLWTWYKKDARAHDPPASIGVKLGSNGQIVKTPRPDTNDSPSRDVESESACPPGNCPSTSAAAASLAATADAPPLHRDVPASTIRAESETNAATLRGDNAQLASLIEIAVKQATDQLLAAFMPQIDDLTRRLENLAKKRTTAAAEDRHQDPRTEK